MKQFYYSFIHSYLTYGNIAWCSTNKTKLIPLYRNQKHAVRVITYKDQFSHSKQIFKELEIFNIFEINALQVLCFTFKCKLKTAPQVFHKLYTLKPMNKYTMRSNGALIEPVCKSKFSEYSISFRAPRLWNTLALQNTDITKSLNFSCFKNKVKDILSRVENMQQYF